MEVGTAERRQCGIVSLRELMKQAGHGVETSRPRPYFLSRL
jgi:hypothetical protein